MQYELLEETAILGRLKKDAIAPVYRRIRLLCHTQYIPVQMRDTLEEEEEGVEDEDGAVWEMRANLTTRKATLSALASPTLTTACRS